MTGGTAGRVEGGPGARVALLRGINVGRAKRVAMAELRALVAELGYSDVRTLLNSGNVVFAASGEDDAGSRIEEALKARLVIASRVTVLTAGELESVVRENSLVDVADNPSRLLVAFPSAAVELARLEPLRNQEWAPEALAIGSHAAYLWCPDGVLASHLPEAVGRLLGDDVTMRNWSTVSKLYALASASS